MCQICNAQDVRRFVLAGNATFTLSSKTTGARYTYKVCEPEHDPKRRYVQVLTGPDNTSNYTYIGMIPDAAAAAPEFKLTKKSRMTEESAPVRAVQYLCSRVLSNPRAPLPSCLEIRHEGCCGRCGRPLTVPESIDRGIGPDCAEKMGIV